MKKQGTAKRQFLVYLWLRGVCKKIGILPISAPSGGNRGKIRKNN